MSKKNGGAPARNLPGGIEHLSYQIMEASPVGFFVYKSSGQCVYVNQAASRMIGASREELQRQNFRLLESWKVSGLLDAAVRVLASNAEYRNDFHFVTTFKREVWLDCTFLPFSGDGANYMMLIANDIIERKQAEQALRKSEEKYRQLVELAQEGIWMINTEGNTTFVNRRMAEMLGYTVEEMAGKSLFSFLDEEGVEAARKNLERRRQGMKEQHDFEFITKDGGRIYTITDATPVHDDKGNYAGMLAVVTDITVRKHWEEELQALTLTDELTGLYNRRGFMTVAQPELNVARRLKKKVCLLFVDVDNMKWINDRLGHKEGDMALIDAATLLSETFRESDVVARISGDEFAIFALETEGMDETGMLARLKETLAGWNAKTKRKYELSLSIGRSCCDPGNPASLEDLIEEADRRMYEHKRKKQVKTPRLHR